MQFHLLWWTFLLMDVEKVFVEFTNDVQSTRGNLVGTLYPTHNMYAFASLRSLHGFP